MIAIIHRLMALLALACAAPAAHAQNIGTVACFGDGTRASPMACVASAIPFGANVAQREQAVLLICALPSDWARRFGVPECKMPQPRPDDR